jgi:hypothetical protein
MDPRVKDRVEEFLADLDRAPIARHLLGVVVSGSAARGEEIWAGDELVSDIDLMVLTRRTSPRLIAGVERVIAAHRHRGIDGGAVPLGPLATYLTCAFYEARCTGVVVRGAIDLASAIPPIGPAELPVWEGVRLIGNRLLEHVKYDTGLITADRVVAKSYEALAEAHLLVERRFRPTYAERLAELERRAPAAPTDAVAGMVAVLRARLDHAAPEQARAGRTPDVATAREHLIDGLARVGARYTRRPGDATAQLRTLARTEWHWRHRAFWTVVLARQGRWAEVRPSIDPIIDVWGRALKLITVGNGDPAKLLEDWRACPQILMRR